MKDIFELADTSSANVTAITPKVISATIEEIRRGKKVFGQFYKINTDLKGSGGTQVEFPTKGSGVVVTTKMSAGNTILTNNMIYDAVTIAVQKHGVGVGFYGEALRQVKRDIIRDAITEAGEAYTDAMDTLAIEAMFPEAIFVSSGAETINSVGTFYIGIKNTIGNVVSMVQGAGTFTVIFGGPGTVNAWYIPSNCGSRRAMATQGSLSAKDVLLARADIEGHNFEPDVLVIHPTMLDDLLYDPAVKFLDAWAYRGPNGTPLANAEIGQLYGMKVIVTNKAPIYGAVLVDSKNLGYEVQRMDLELKKDEITGMKTDMLYFYGFSETAFGVVNKRAYGAIYTTGTFTALQPTR